MLIEHFRPKSCSILLGETSKNETINWNWCFPNKQKYIFLVFCIDSNKQKRNFLNFVLFSYSFVWALKFIASKSWRRLSVEYNNNAVYSTNASKIMLVLQSMKRSRLIDLSGIFGNKCIRSISTVHQMPPHVYQPIDIAIIQNILQMNPNSISNFQFLIPLDSLNLFANGNNYASHSMAINRRVN